MPEAKYAQFDNKNGAGAISSGFCDAKATSKSVILVEHNGFVWIKKAFTCLNCSKSVFGRH